MKAQTFLKNVLTAVILAHAASTAFAVTPSNLQPLQSATTVQQVTTGHLNVSENGFDRTPLGERIAEDGFDRTPLGERIAEGGFSRTPLGKRIA